MAHGGSCWIRQRKLQCSLEKRQILRKPFCGPCTTGVHGVHGQLVEHSQHSAMIWGDWWPDSGACNKWTVNWTRKLLYTFHAACEVPIPAARLRNRSSQPVRWPDLHSSKPRGNAGPGRRICGEGGDYQASRRELIHGVICLYLCHGVVELIMWSAGVVCRTWFLWLHNFMWFHCQVRENHWAAIWHILCHHY